MGHDGEATPFDEEYNVVQAQPFYSHFLHRALRQDNKFDIIAENIRTRWSAMLADGESTFRETWQLEPDDEQMPCVVGDAHIRSIC